MWAVEHASMMCRSMVDSLFPEAEIIVEHSIGLPKSFVAVRQQDGCRHRS
jgi:hypothetical protein